MKQGQNALRHDTTKISVAAPGWLVKTIDEIAALNGKSREDMTMGLIILSIGRIASEGGLQEAALAAGLMDAKARSDKQLGHSGIRTGRRSKEDLIGKYLDDPDYDDDAV